MHSLTRPRQRASTGRRPRSPLGSLVIVFSAACSGRAETFIDGTPPGESRLSLLELPSAGTSGDPAALPAGEAALPGGEAGLAACTALPRTCERTSLPLQAAAAGAGEPPRLSSGGSYGVQLPAVDLTAEVTGVATPVNYGVVSFTPEVSGRHELLLGTPNLPVRVIADGVEIGSACTRRFASDECDAFRRANVYELSAGVEYHIELGPIEPQRWVRLRVEAPPRPLEPRLVFTAALGGERQRDLYSIREDGSGLTRLTFTADQSETGPRWSPDHSRVSFLAGSRLFAHDVANGDVVLLAPEVGRDGWGATPAAWSPDGARVVYPHPRPSWIVEFDDGEIVDESYATLLHFVDADGSNDVPFSEPPDSGLPPGLGSWYFPTWSTDGWIAAQLGDDCPDCPGGWQYVLAREDGSELRSIGFDYGRDTFPESDLDWSPDGQRWVYTTLRGRIDSASTSDPLDTTALASESAHTARWSPDGTSVAFLRADGIYLVDANGDNERRIFAAEGVSGLDW